VLYEDRDGFDQEEVMLQEGKTVKFTRWSLARSTIRSATMKRMLTLTGIVVLGLASFFAYGGTHAEETIFNGKDLSGWDGDPRLWSVKDGAIRGQTTEENPAAGNTFCIWRGGTLKNFILKIKFRIENGNSGIQYRSKDLGNWVVSGYQAEVENKQGKVGFLYHEGGRGWMVNVGDIMVVDEEGNKNVVGKIADQEALVKAGYYREKDWNEYTIIARGNHLVHILNGFQTMEMIDNDPKGRSMEGILALQIHAGPPMVVEFEDIRVTHLPDHFGEAKLLFNGKDLDGWTFSSDQLKETWSVKDGVLATKGRPIGYIRTKEDFTNYVLWLEFRHLGRGNGGVLLRMVGPDKVWPRSIEAQGQYGAAGDIWNINAFPMKTDAERTSGRHTRKMHESNEKAVGEWNRYEITLDGPDLELKVNGLVQNTATECWETPGKVCLQSEGSPMEFRNIVLLPISPSGLSGVAFEEMLPEDTMFYVSVPDATELVKKFKDSNGYKIIREIDVVGLMSREPQFQQVKALYGTFVQPLTEVFRGRIGLAVKNIPREPGIPGVILLADVDGKREQLRQYFEERIHPLLKKGGVPAVSFKHGEYEVQQLSFAKPVPFAVCYTIADDVFIATVGRRTIEELLDQPKRERSLADSTLFQDVRQRVGEDSDILGYANVSRLLEVLVGAVPSEGQALLEALGLTGVKAAGFGVEAQGAGVKQVLFLYTGPERKGLLRLLTRKAGPLKVVEYIPEDMTYFCSISLGDFAEFWDEVMDMLRGVVHTVEGERGWQRVVAGLRRAEIKAGFRIRDDVLSPFAGELCIAAKVPEVMGLPPVFVFIEVKDAEKARALMQKLMGALERAVGAPVVRTTEDYKGVGITSFTLSPAGGRGFTAVAFPFVRPAFGVVGDFLVVSFHSRQVKKIVDVHQGGASLKDVPEFKRVMAKLSERPASVTSYLNWRELYDFVYGAFGGIAAARVGPDLTAKLGRISQYFGSSASRVSFDEKGIASEAFSESGGGEEILLQVAVLGFLMPAIISSKGKAQEVMCRSNLQQLAVTCMMYANDRGALPSKLSDLYPEYVDGLGVFVCPAHKGRKISKERIDADSDYELAIPGAQLGGIKDIGNTVMILEKEPNHRGGRNAAYADGHVARQGAETAPR